MIEVPAVPATHLREAPAGEPSVEIRGRVVASRERQRARLAGHRLHTNGEIQGRLIWQYCRPDAAGLRLLDAAVSRLTLSARAYDRVLKVARTIADLAASDGIGPPPSPKHCSTGCDDQRLAHG